MTDKDPTLMARCPECDSRIYFDRRPDVGEIIVCPECEASLETVSYTHLDVYKRQSWDVRRSSCQRRLKTDPLAASEN